MKEAENLKVEAVAPAAELVEFSDVEALEESFAMSCTG